MTEVQALFGVLRQTVQPEIVDALEQLVNEAPDRRLARVNALAFAAREGLDEEQAIAGFLHASRLGLRSEEHTSELQSLMRNSYAGFCLKKKKHIHQNILPKANTSLLTISKKYSKIAN